MQVFIIIHTQFVLFDPCSIINLYSTFQNISCNLNDLAALFVSFCVSFLPSFYYNNDFDYAYSFSVMFFSSHFPAHFYESGINS